MTANSLQPQRPSSPPQIIALYGGKGGAGKTSSYVAGAAGTGLERIGKKQSQSQILILK